MIVTLCGSTRFKREFEIVNKFMTMHGFLVFSVACFGHADGEEFSAAEKAQLDDVHLQKIDHSHYVVVIDVGGYVGESTAREVLYARRKGVKICYVSDLQEDHHSLWPHELGQHKLHELRRLIYGA